MSSRHKNRGFTLLEVMVVLIIGAIVIAIAASGIGRAFSGSETTTEARNINDLMAAAQSMKGPDGFASVTLPLLASVKAIPTNLNGADTGATVTNSWNGAVTLSGNANAFTISYAAMPKDACITIATKMAEAGTLAVHSGTTAITTAAQAQTSCAADTNTNQLSFTYNATAPVS